MLSRGKAQIDTPSFENCPREKFSFESDAVKAARLGAHRCDYDTATFIVEALTTSDER